jgi:hypothetical protein
VYTCMRHALGISSRARRDRDGADERLGSV